jgi:hypothetical protein
MLPCSHLNARSAALCSIEPFAGFVYGLNVMKRCENQSSKARSCYVSRSSAKDSARSPDYDLIRPN